MTDTIDTTLDPARPPPDVGTLFATHARGLRVYVYSRCGDPGVADDIVQETFFEAWRLRRGLHARPQFKGWLYEKAYHLLQHYWRDTERYQKRKDKYAEQGAMRVIDSEEALARRRRIEQFRAHITALPEAYREVVALSGCGDFEAAEIADILNIPVNTVYVKLHRGKKLLKEHWGANPDAPDHALEGTPDPTVVWAWLVAYLPPELVEQAGTAGDVASGLDRLAASTGTTSSEVLAGIARMKDDDRAELLLGRVLRRPDDSVAEILDLGEMR